MASGNHINDLPAEILQEIFLCVISNPKHLCWDSSNPNLIDFSSTPSSPYTANYHSPASPYSSSHVCRKWRYITCSFPHLWTHLCVVMPRKEDLSHLTRIWLARAGSFPLYLFLNEGPNVLVGTKAVLKSFIEHIHKWKSFQMESRNGLNNLVEPEVLQTLPASPVLEHLGLNFYRITGSAWAHPLFNILIQSPALRSVMLVSSSSFIHFKHIWAPKWQNITELKLRAQSHALSALFDGLSYCQNLRRLGIYGEIFHWSPLDSKKLVLPHLTYLSVPAYKSIFTRLTLPSISGLHLTILQYSATPWSSIAMSLNRSRPLEVLKVHHIGGRFFVPDFIISLREPYFQRLKVLEVEYPLGVEIIKSLIQMLPAKQGGPESETGFLPHLEKLSLVLQVPFRDDHRHEVEQLIKSRFGASSSITTLQISKEVVHFTLNIPPAD